jgi:hypothetical protein
VVRLVGLWTEPSDIDAFEWEYLGSHFPQLRSLANAQRSLTSRCLDGPYFRMTEVNFTSIDDIHVALQADLGKDILASARTLADKFGVRLEVLVVAEAG